MALLNMNFNDVPNEIPPIGAGVRKLVVTKVEGPVEKVRGDGAKDQVLNVELAVNDDSEEKGRRTFVSPSVIDPRGKVLIKRLALSCGVTFTPEGGLDTTGLVGRACEGVISHSVVAEKGQDGGFTGRSKTYANVRDFVIPGDAVATA